MKQITKDNYNGAMTLRSMKPYSLDEENTRKLWILSGKLTDVLFITD